MSENTYEWDDEKISASVFIVISDEQKVNL